jgi:hypothetical protein
MQVPSGNSGSSRGDWSPVIVRVNTEGVSGFGEAWLAYGKGWRGGFGMVQDFAEVIIGEDPIIQKTRGCGTCPPLVFVRCYAGGNCR